MTVEGRPVVDRWGRRLMATSQDNETEEKNCSEPGNALHDRSVTERRQAEHPQPRLQIFSDLAIAAASSCSISEGSEWSQSLARALTLLISCLSRACDRESCEFVAALALENMQSVSSNTVYFCASQQYFQ